MEATTSRSRGRAVEAVYGVTDGPSRFVSHKKEAQKNPDSEIKSFGSYQDARESIDIDLRTKRRKRRLRKLNVTSYVVFERGVRKRNIDIFLVSHRTEDTFSRLRQINTTRSSTGTRKRVIKNMPSTMLFLH